MSRLIKSFGYAIKGIAYTFKTQPNFKFHSAATVVVIIIGLYFNLATSEWLWISTAIGMVLIAELINTAIETLVDLVSPTFHVKAGIVKDAAAGAVLITAILAAIIGLFIFIPKLL
jgi:diacylglycerol kinase